MICQYTQTIMSISLFCCCEKVSTHMNIWVIAKNSMKNHYLKKIFLESLKHGRYYWYRLTHAKTAIEVFKIKQINIMNIMI